MKRTARSSFGSDGSIVTSIGERLRSNSRTRSRLNAQVIRTQYAEAGAALAHARFG